MDDAILLCKESESIKHLYTVDKRLERVISEIGHISYSTPQDDFTFLVSTIIGQMLSNSVADVLTDRFFDLCNGVITPASIKALTDDEIRGIGLAYSKARFLRNLSTAVTEGTLNFTELKSLSDPEIIKRLTTIKGIGMWTAKMYLIFVLDRQDVLPYEDMAFIQSYKWLYKADDLSKEAVERKCKKWKPYSSIAARYLYRALDMGYTKTPFHLYKPLKRG